MGDFAIQDGELRFYNGSGGAAVVPDGVTEIGACAFLNCKALTSVTIPESVASIGKWAFDGCTGLTAVTVRRIVLQQDDFARIREKAGVGLTDVIDLLVSYNYTNKGIRDLDAVAVALYAFRRCQDDVRNNEFLWVHFSFVLYTIMEESDLHTLMLLQQCGYFDDLFRANIDSMIEIAITSQQYEIQLYLTNYKKEKIGYTDAAEQFKL
ncbi:MAG: leucine-rich repeat domain-containing protein [Oscillospiraceae bacterium]|nr:leucine-rich repeat domain-containing protein [Oscillospiraceae bacterium]